MAEVLTHTEKFSQQKFEDYSNSYSEIGHILKDNPIIHQLPQKIAKTLPQNFNAVNLGSGNGQQTSQILDICKSLGKQGTFINVDPFITQENVLKISGQEFIQNQKQKSLDLILLNQSFHFNKDHDEFFRAAYRCLKETGKIIIVQMGNQCRIPWTQALQENFLKLLLLANDFIPKHLFKWELIKEKKEIRLNKGAFRELIKRRGLSNLLTHTQREIQECLADIDSKQQLEKASIWFWLFTIEKL